MLITKQDLYLALEYNKPLFHDEDVIDDDVYYELFLAEPEMKKAGNGSCRLMNKIDKQQRIILYTKGLSSCVHQFDADHVYMYVEIHPIIAV